MNQLFYRVVVDPSIDTGWFLGEPIDSKGHAIDARSFTEGRYVAINERLLLPIVEAGEPLSFLLAAFDMPVVAHELGEIIAQIAPHEVQRLPVTIQGGIDGYEILNILRVATCVDEDRSQVMRWTTEDHRPDLAGTYRMILNLKVKFHESPPPHICRIKDYEIALIVSETIKDALERAHVRGVKFQPV